MSSPLFRSYILLEYMTNNSILCYKIHMTMTKAYHNSKSTFSCVFSPLVIMLFYTFFINIEKCLGIETVMGEHNEIDLKVSR